MKFRGFLFFALLCISCTKKNPTVGFNLLAENHVVTKTPFPTILKSEDTTFVDLKSYSSHFILDIKYATSDNFLKAKVYDCASCYLRLKTVKKLIEASVALNKKGYKVKIFDCYRPLSVQKKMWDIVQDANYVANPARGSIHNRGGAVDITLTDKNGKELDMGTPFDFFGVESSHNYKKLSKSILKNRLLLKNTMLKHNFESLETEWWHYNLEGAKQFPLSNFNWNCN
jgi:zinc D-Ala-D-Ala dipeptidase